MFWIYKHDKTFLIIQSSNHEKSGISIVTSHIPLIFTLPQVAVLCLCLVIMVIDLVTIRDKGSCNESEILMLMLDKSTYLKKLA